ncbi:MAG: hypothetical protein GXX79_02640 [Actinomycetales bacterium]|nr:hypothetical protein [Actinomycetales bacterium]
MDEQGVERPNLWTEVIALWTGGGRQGEVVLRGRTVTVVAVVAGSRAVAGP